VEAEVEEEKAEDDDEPELSNEAQLKAENASTKEIKELEQRVEFLEKEVPRLKGEDHPAFPDPLP